MLTLILLATAAAEDLTRPSGELIFPQPTMPIADRSDRWRERRAEALDRILERSSPGPERGSWLEERGDLYTLQAREALEEAYSEYDKALDRGLHPEWPGIQADAHSEAAATCYREALVTAEGPRAARIGMALGATLTALNRYGEAASAWRSVLDADPGAPWAADARLQLAEHAFAGADLTAALGHYTAVLDYGASETSVYVHYKMAWTLYNLGDAASAIDHLIPVATSNASTLAKEARKDVIRFSANLPYGGAVEQLSRVCEADARCITSMTPRLRDLWLDAGRTDDANRLGP